MLKSEVKWSPTFRYRTHSEWEPIGFFSDALCNAESFDLMLGFFSSSAINVLSYAFATFLYNGGKMRMIINDILSSDDAEAIENGWSEEQIPYFNLNDLDHLSSVLKKRDRHFFECLSWLIRNDKIELKVIRMVGGNGIAHTKCGTFYDGINYVSFEGSLNFSVSAFIHNKEAITVACDWNGEADVCRIKGVNDSFLSAFLGEDKDLEFVDSTNLKNHITTNYKSKDIEELLHDELALIDDVDTGNLPASIKTALLSARNKVRQAIDKCQEEHVEKLPDPAFPYASGPRAYQRQAFSKWKGSQRGLFAMATGTGKTLTALNCLLEIYKQKGYYKAIILVPTLTLVEQWASECEKFKFSHIIKICSKSKVWRTELDDIRLLETYASKGSEPSYIIIATYASFARDTIFDELTHIHSRLNKKLLFIADEAHNMGSPKILNKLGGIHYNRRIGLSATPERQFDDKGNKELRKFFGCEAISGYTFEFNMQEAIDKGYLCRYYYYPHVVHLTDAEMAEYQKISLQLSKFYNYDDECFPGSDEILLRLLLKRKRIVHKASNKEKAFEGIVQDWYQKRGSLKYTLVYVPEGSKPDNDTADYYDETESTPKDNYTDALIDRYSSIVVNVSETTTVRKFVSGTSDRDQILEDFGNGNLGVLTSMKCLDEGIDVPRSELAIFCASTGNPRQFIQRRGRILRTHPDKKFAVIHDLIVVPEVSPYSDNYKMERSLLASELKRIRDFAHLSENLDYTLDVLDDTLAQYQLSIF